MIGTATSVINKPRPKVTHMIRPEFPIVWDEDDDDDDDEELLMAQNVLAMLAMVLEDEENGIEIEEI